MVTLLRKSVIIRIVYKVNSLLGMVKKKNHRVIYQNRSTGIGIEQV